MSVELLYTSAPNGLKQGSRGFCTVLSTQGMPVNLASRLELLSGYRHIFPPQDAQANLNPVAWSHVSLTVAGQTTSILSRIAAYGVDYSGRTNKLAHHVVVGPNERIAAGPAWLLQSPGVMRSQWDGVCETPASGPAIPQGNQTARVCATWKSLTGDAGWGGVVAEALVAPASKPLWVIYRLDQQRSLLELMNEAISLLPESQRWQATFSTYYTNLPPEVDCKVRFVVEGTEEATKLASRGSSILLAPGVPLTSASAFVESARTGTSITMPAPAAPITRPAAPIDMWDEPANKPMHRPSKVSPPSATLGTSIPESPPAIALPPKFKGTTPPAISARLQKGSKAKIAAIVGVLLILVLLSGGGYAWYQSQRQPYAKLDTKTTIQSPATKAKNEKNEKVNTAAVEGGQEQREPKTVTMKTDTDDKPAKTQTLPEPPPTKDPNALPPGTAPITLPSATTTPESPPGPTKLPMGSGTPASTEPVGGTPGLEVVPAEPARINPIEGLSSSAPPKSREIKSTSTEVAALDLNASLDADKTFASFLVKREKLKGIATVTFNPGAAVDKGAVSISNRTSLTKLDSAPPGLSKPKFEEISKKPSVRLTVGKNSELILAFDDSSNQMIGWLVIHDVPASASNELEAFVEALASLKLEKNALVEKLKNQADVFTEGLNVNMAVLATEYVKTESHIFTAISEHNAKINARLAELKTELEKSNPNKEKRSELDAEKTKLDRSLKFFGDIQKQMKSISKQLQVLKKGTDLGIGKLTLYPNPSNSQASGLKTQPAPMDVIDLTIKLQLVEQP